MIDFDEFSSLSLESPSVSTSIQYVFYLYEENKSGSSVNKLRYRMFIKNNLGEDCIPLTYSFIKNMKYDMEKTFSMHKIPYYIKQFFFLIT